MRGLHFSPLFFNNGFSPSFQIMSSETKQDDSQPEEQDVISKSIGDFGRWQLTLTFLLSLFNLPCTWHIYALTFQSPSNVQFWCTPPDNLLSLPVHVWQNISHTPALGNVSGSAGISPGRGRPKRANATTIKTLSTGNNYWLLWFSLSLSLSSVQG